MNNLLHSLNCARAEVNERHNAATNPEEKQELIELLCSFERLEEDLAWYKNRYSELDLEMWGDSGAHVLIVELYKDGELCHVTIFSILPPSDFMKQFKDRVIIYKKQKWNLHGVVRG